MTDRPHPEWGAPQTYRSYSELGFLTGKSIWAVRMNNAINVLRCDDQADAELQAARLNYREGCYYKPRQIGLDGV